MTTDKPHALYRFYDDLGQLLYVGITNDMSRRMDKHADTKTWWAEVRGVTIEWYAGRESVLAAEKRAVQVEQPLHNIRLKRKQLTQSTRTLAVVPPTSQRIDWECQECGLLVRDNDGYIHVDWGAAGRLERERTARDDARRARGDWAVDLAELLSGPEDVRWEVHHRKCDPNPDRDDYWFGVERARTLAHLLDWTFHLSEKRWALDATNWVSFARSVASKCGGVDA